MAFFSKVGNILRQSTAVSKQISSDHSVSSPSLLQFIRCMSTSKLFIGGLSYSTDDQSLKEAFNHYGEVVEARVIMDRETGRSRGFGFVSFTSNEEASSAIQALDGQDLHGRQVRVNYATERPRSNFGGGGGYGNYGGGGGSYGGGDGGYGGGDRYGSGGGNYSSYGSGGGGGNIGETSAGNFGSAGNYGGANSFDSGSSFGATGGGSDNFVSDNASGGGSPGVGGQFSSSGMNNVSGGFTQEAPLEGSFRDENDEPEDFAKRA